MNNKVLTPKEIVKALNKYVIGQDAAKKSVAIALRNRWRRQQVSEELREEIMPNNIIMIGPTGVGKTEIARRLAKIASAPFVKVEATTFTEVGYVGRDVEFMVRDLMNTAVNMEREKRMKDVIKDAERVAEEKLIDLLLPHSDEADIRNETREKIRNYIKEGKMKSRKVEIDVDKSPPSVIELVAGGSLDEIDMNMKNMISSMFSKEKKKKLVSVEEARNILTRREAERMINMDEIVQEAKWNVENNGIIFIDEIDKIAGREEGTGPDVSRMGVQRDILPLIEGTNVMSKYGIIRTHHILFIAAGAFSTTKPSDLIPELQGRFPIRVELSSLGREEFKRILIEPKNSLVSQYRALLASEGVELEFKEEAIEEIAKYSELVNQKTEDIGARRLHTVLNTLLEDILYETPSRKKKVVITGQLVKKKLEEIAGDSDLSRYIL